MKILQKQTYQPKLSPALFALANAAEEKGEIVDYPTRSVKRHR